MYVLFLTLPSHFYTCQLFLRCKREIFILGVLGFLKTTRSFPKIPEKVRSLLKKSEHDQSLPKSDHVYFVHPSTNISVDISVDILTDTRPMYRSTYRPSAYRYVGRHIGRVSVNMSTAMCRSTYRPMCQPRYRPNDGRHIDRLSADILADIAAGTRPIR